MRLVGRQNKCPAVTLEAAFNLAFSLETILSLAPGYCGCNSLPPTDSVLPRSYFSSSSAFLIAVWGRRTNELWVSRLLQSELWGCVFLIIGQLPRTALRKVPCDSPFPSKRDRRCGGGVVTPGVLSSSHKDQRQNRRAIVLAGVFYLNLSCSSTT